MNKGLNNGWKSFEYYFYRWQYKDFYGVYGSNVIYKGNAYGLYGTSLWHVYDLLSCYYLPRPDSADGV